MTNGKNNKNYHSCVMLMEVLQKAKCPLNVFDKVIDWARQSNAMGVIFDENFDYTRKKLLKEIDDVFDLHGLKPYISQYKMLATGETVPLIYFEFLEALYSMLNDPEVMHPDNLLDEAQLEKEQENDDNVILGDINTGSVWRQAVKIYIRDPRTQKIIPIIFFIDKTHTDIHGRLKLEPLMFTLGIFKQECRTKPMFWRNLGFVTDTEASKSAEGETKMQDYHNMLKIILESFIKVQGTPIEWEFVVDGQKRKMHCYLPVLFIIGDTDGHDRLCGRYLSRAMIECLCRYCNIKFKNTDDPFAKYKFTRQDVVNKLCDQNRKIKLKDMSMHCIQNAWRDVDFCDNVRGLHGATLAEVLHVLQQGLDEYVLDCFMYSRKESQQSKAHSMQKKVSGKKRKHDDAEDLYYKPLTEEELSSRCVFGPQYRDRFERLCKKYGAILQHQSDRDLPRTKMYSKYTSKCCKNGHEMAGLFITFLMIFCSDEENKLSKDNSLGKDRASAFIHVFELMLLLEHFAQSKYHIKGDIKSIFEPGIPVVLETIKNTIDRRTGNGMKLIKFHLVVHFAGDILRYGSMTNFNSAVGEFLHIPFCKDTAKNTQRRKDKIEQQAGHRQCEYIKICRAARHSNKVFQKINVQSHSATESDFYCRNIVFDGKKNAFLKLDSCSRKYVSCSWQDTKMNNYLSEMCRKIIIDGKVHGEVIPFFTEFRKDGQILRADPAYGEKQEPWQDWAFVDWGDDIGQVPSKLLIFMDLREIYKEEIQVGDTSITAPGCFAITYSLPLDDLTRIERHEISLLVEYGKLDLNSRKQPKLHAFNVTEKMLHPCVAAPYRVEDDIMKAKEWIFLKPRWKWYTVFSDHLEKWLIENEMLEPLSCGNKRSTIRRQLLEKKGYWDTQIKERK